MTPTLEDSIAPSVRREIDARLDAVARDNGVRLLLAVESGSRAWGFPSPDSDYDVRFVYVHDRDWYLRLQAGRDVIEAPIEDEIDLNGWDVRKAIGLLLRSNAVIGEWLESPIRYRSDHPVVAELRALADAVFDARALAHHYASQGLKAMDRHLDGSGDAPVKRYFYALRPALAMRALRLDPETRPPMNLQALVAAAAVPESVAQDIAALVEAKSRTRERANIIRLPELDALIRSELVRAPELPTRGGVADVRDRANRLFLDLVNS